MTVQPTRDQLRALADAATPGPWEAHVEQYSSEVGDYHGAYIPGVADEFVSEFDGSRPPLSPEDADLIEAYYRAVPQLLDQLDAAEARIKAVQDVLAQFEHTNPGSRLSVEGEAALFDGLRRALDA